MKNENSAPAKMQPNPVKPAEKSEILTDACAKIEAEAKEKDRQSFADYRGNFSKPKTMNEICDTMKAEIKDEAKRLVPDPDNQH